MNAEERLTKLEQLVGEVMKAQSVISQISESLTKALLAIASVGEGLTIMETRLTEVEDKVLQIMPDITSLKDDPNICSICGKPDELCTCV